MAVLKEMPDGSKVNLKMIISVEPIAVGKYEVIMGNNTRKTIEEVDLARDTLLADIEAAHI